MSLVLLATLFVLLLLLGWVLTIFGFPGNWLMVAVFAAFTAWVLPLRDGVWTPVMISVVLAAAGEAAEFFAGAAGLSRGGSRRGALLATIFSLVGSFAGAAVGLPLPVVGSVLGVVLGACLGAMLGQIVGDLSSGHSLAQSLALGRAAFWFRLLGTAAKIVLGTAILGVALVTRFWG